MGEMLAEPLSVAATNKFLASNKKSRMGKKAIKKR
jgi:hypothetical protein